MKKILLLFLIPLATFSQRFGVVDTQGAIISSKSTAGLNYTDMNASSGEVGIRLFKGATQKWLLRNRGTDDYFEILQGTATSRFLIQPSTGNIGIGGVPVYRLDVIHGGTSGIKNRSTAGSSLFDIDAFNGDAAFRLLKANTLMWNIRNRPSDNYLEVFEYGVGTRMVIQDGTGNVGIGEASNPAYRLDVLHPGTFGIRNRSSAGASLIDIDASNGDAAVRFQKAGALQWNVRNRPSDNFFEIFEYGANSRLVIQDGTGNVGIGEGSNPAYRLDVLHGGATGIRSRSSSSYSLVDIDASTGDAALRFGKAGVYQWNIRNNPENDDLQFFELNNGGERMRIENNTGRVVIPGTLVKGGGSFKIDHPLDPENKYLSHSFVESPDMMNIYNGNIITDASGKASVKLPAYFEALNMEFRYQLTVIGSFSQAIVAEEIHDNVFEVATDKPNVKVSWQVTGVRKDAFAKSNRIPNEELKKAEERGRYLHPRAFGKPETMGVWFRNDMKNGRANGPVSSIDDTPVAGSNNKPITQSNIGTSTDPSIVPPQAEPKKPVEGPQSTDN